ncbi:UvrD-helicase domain-containing protein [Melioribacter sp. OK-6-Me]|uniref:UvrD-helicase domain-containing protein n=1 Tax=unclassified Melioribacter TaxID=2627329 RepID=UPI003ED8E519
MKKLTPFQDKALRYDKNILLTANAGAGKTFVFARRYVDILLNENLSGNVDIENIVAITFTDKAAGELQKRIAIEIEERIKNETNFTKRKVIESLRSQLVNANISTIHSFCLNILREFAPEANLDANFIPIEQSEADDLLEICIDDALKNMIEVPEESERLKFLIRFFGGKYQLITNIKQSISKRKIIENINEFYAKSTDEILMILKQIYEHVLKLIFADDLHLFLNAVETVNRKVKEVNPSSSLISSVDIILSRQLTQENLPALLSNLRELKSIILTSSTRKLSNRGYLNKERETVQREIQTIENFLSDFNNIIDCDWEDNVIIKLIEFGKAFIHVVEKVIELYNNKKKARGYVDFEDILLLTEKVVKLESAREYLRTRYKYIMIDEYQDTNELQYNIFMPILDFLKHGNLFVVGDEKQSIYMFRNAELEVFNKTRNVIESKREGGAVLTLPHSFRLSPPIVLFVNKLFENLFSVKNEELRNLFNEVKYDKLICARPETEKGKVELLIANGGEISEEMLVADKIYELLNYEKLNPGDIGILCRKRKLFDRLETEFIKREIPYSIVGGRGFYQQQVVGDVFNYLSFIINRENDAALVGILRSPFYSISDSELLEISMTKGNSFYEKLINISKTDEKYKQVASLLAEHIRLATFEKPYALIRRILLDTGYWAVISSKRDAEQQLANLNKLIAIARNFTIKNFVNLYDFREALRNYIENFEDESQAAVSKNQNAVNLLTIHQAKGLEYKAVFVFGANETSGGYDGIGIDKQLGIISKVYTDYDFTGEKKSNSIETLYNYIVQKKEIAEMKRLFYVALTRAENYLFITSSRNDIKKNSFMDLLSNGLKIENIDGIEEINLYDEVEFMNLDSKEIDVYSKKMELKIPVHRNLSYQDSIYESSKNNTIEKKPLIGEIEDEPEKEIISATKIAIFNQCPIKYQLIYELGYSLTFEIVKQKEFNYDFKDNEDDEVKSYSDVKGRIIHAILEKETKYEEIEKQLSDLLQREMIHHSIEEMKKNILNDLKKFYESSTYDELQKYKSYINEAEFYAQDGKNYLYGIIDKLIFENDKLIIVDYKTDNVDENEIHSKAENYFPQLKFYAYLISKVYPEVNRYEVRLIFIKHPDISVKKDLTRKEVEQFGNVIRSTIDKINKSDYSPNLNHCRKCHYALKGGKCIKSFS